ncbi:hypothetical protein E6C27_scaffold428G00120 [Cucumis melo var. makuwa]|uniref:Uncharacterized protein n=1 Tax=Cucumis melo var. makuwa TaxID=1194695 RepID=A0A5A7UE66_CUCMM|nr:hypothetical protein E6C27_scaffold428G00120 [Cucumis melo var. makuwa]
MWQIHLILDYKLLEIDEKLAYEEPPVEILAREIQHSSAVVPSISILPLGLTQSNATVRHSSDRVCPRPAALCRVEAEPVVELLQAAKHHCHRTPEDPSLVVDPLSVDSIEGHNQVSGKGFPTTGPWVEAGNVTPMPGCSVYSSYVNGLCCELELYVDGLKSLKVMYVVVYCLDIGYAVTSSKGCKGTTRGRSMRGKKDA